jgi:hypothetical protein
MLFSLNARLCLELTELRAPSMSNLPRYSQGYSSAYVYDRHHCRQQDKEEIQTFT